MAVVASKTQISVPLNDTDKIIGILSGTINITAPTGGLGDAFRTVTDARSTGFGEACYFRGIFSTNGGTTWNDFGSATPDFSSGFPIFQTVECIATCSSTGVVSIKGTNWIIGSAATILYKVALIASNTQGNITPLPINSNTFFSSTINYQKIAMQGELPWTTTPGVTQSKTITHSLGVIPKIRAFYRKSDGTIEAITNDEIQIDNQITTTTLTFFLDDYRSGFLSAISGQIEWRIYLDA